MDYWSKGNVQKVINENFWHKMMFLIFFFFASHQFFDFSLQQTGISVKKDKF